MTAPLLELTALEKRFGSTLAVSDVSLTLGAGEILALVGENGAGKTTLLSLLTGAYTSDSGEIRVDGKLLPKGNPRAAEAAGLGLVPQHSELVGPLTLAENAVLGREPRRGLLFDRSRAERELKEVGDFHGLPLDPRARADSLSVVGKQRAEIVKLLWRGARILCLDEPTATLAPSEISALLETLLALAKEGRGIILVSHKLAEVQRVAQRIAVLRRGKLAAILPGSASLSEVAEAMAGETAPVSDRPTATSTASTARSAGTGGQALGLREVRVVDDRGQMSLDRVSLEIGKGEIVGVAGVDGNGQRELVELVIGLREAKVGSVSLGGHDVTRRSIHERRALGLAYVPEDRMHGGLCADLSSAENLALGRLPSLSRFGLLRSGAVAARARTSIASGDVRPTLPGLRAGGLSGGNQQKLLLARELDGPRTLVVASQPTRGLDPRATAHVRERLLEQAQAGAGVLLVSQDLDELRALCHRIVVLYRGTLADSLPVADATDARLSRAMLGPEGSGAEATA